MSALARWYSAHGRHDLPWRQTTGRWAVLVSEVMLAQTQVARVVAAWPAFMAEFPTPAALARAGPAAALRAWGRLGYPRRARRLWEAAVVITEDGWPRDARALPGVGRYTVGALEAQVDNRPDALAVDVNIRRVVQRVCGRQLTVGAAEDAARRYAAPLAGRDRLLALMDLGALVCTPRAPACGACPLASRCATRGPLPGEGARRQERYAGSRRARRGAVLARLRAEPCVAVGELDGDALASLVADGLATVRAGSASLPDR